MTTRAVVLAAGRGTRMQAASEGAALDPAQAAAAGAGLKAMMPIAGRPFLDYVLHSLADAGISDVALVLAPGHDGIREHYRRAPLSRLRVSFLTQEVPRGTADAVLCAEDWAGRDTFLTLNADNLYPPITLAMLVMEGAPSLPGFLRDSLGLPLDRIAAFALVETDQWGRLTRIREKPGRSVFEARGPVAYVSMNIWHFDARIFEACRDVPVSTRGEKELPQAVGLSASRGARYHVFSATGPVLDLSRREDVAEVERALAGVQVRL